MKKAFIITLFLLANCSVFAQTGIKTKLADKKFHHFHYVEAAKLYEEILAGGFNGKAAENLAHCYRKMNDSENAEKWYAQIASKTSAENKLFYAQALAMNGKYDESKRWYDIYAKEAGKDNKNHKAPDFISAYKNLSDFYKDSARYRIELCPFNSTEADFSPMFFRDGLVFVSNRNDSLTQKNISKHTFKWNNSRYLDLYAVDLPEDTEPHHLHTKTLNTRFHEGPVAFFGAGDSIVFTRNNYSKGRLGKSKDDIHKLKIYFAEGKEGEDGDWKNITEFTYNSDQYSTGHPALTPDNNAMYFSSDMPGGYGGTDIYVSVFNNGRWSKPKNLGTEINTKSNEMFPYVDKNNDLYFASNGHAGMGGLDIFVSKSLNGKYIKPKNMGAPLNSSQDDFALIFDDDNDTGYFTSNRKTGVGDDDIYKFKVKRCKFIGVVINKITNEIIPDAQVEVFENQNAVGFIPERKDSVFFTFKSRLHTTYGMVANKQGFRQGENVLTEQELLVCLLKGEDISDTIRIYLEPDNTPVVTNNYTDPKTGKTYRFRDPNVKVVEITNVYFDFDKYNIRRDANMELERVVEVMNQYPSMMIELSSHTDSRATNYYNIRLGQRRSSASYHYLIRRGIDPARIRVNSFGENKLVVDCPDFKDCSEEEHQLNRRTEIIILTY